jgi:hypothetical protein
MRRARSTATTTTVALALALAVAILATAAACDLTSPGGTLDVAFDFADGRQGWTAGFADYPAGQEDFFDLQNAYAPLPAPLGPASALFISGDNHSDDLFMYFTRRLDGLEPNALYDATFDVEIATDVPFGCGGVGGSPGESVWLKAGAVTTEPQTVLDELGNLRLTIDKGNQAVGGAAALVLGTIENSTPCEAGTRPWELKAFTHPGAPLPVRADAEGAVWLLMGTDSGFEAVTAIFYTLVAARFEPQ